MFALLFIAAVWFSVGLGFYRMARAARLTGSPRPWGQGRFAPPVPELPALGPQAYPIIGPATAATGGLDPSAYAADVAYPKKDSPFIF